MGVEGREELCTGKWRSARGLGQQGRSKGSPTHGHMQSTQLIRNIWPPSSPPAGTIPPIKSAQGEGDDVKKLFTIGCPVILATLGVALLFIVRKKRKEKRLKRLRGGGGSFLRASGQECGPSAPWPRCMARSTTWMRGCLRPFGGELTPTSKTSLVSTAPSSAPPGLGACPSQG